MRTTTIGLTLRFVMIPEVLPLRQASRELVRELGFLQARDDASRLSHSHCHALIEVEARERVRQAELPALLRLDKSTTSRIVAELEARGFVRAAASAEDARARILALTAAGKKKVAEVHAGANARVEDALRLLGDEERRAVVSGMRLYARALERSRLRAHYRIRPIAARDRAGVARLIRTVMPEFGADGPGFAIHDPEVDDMFAAYRGPGASYWVVVEGTGQGKKENEKESERVVGGGGFAALAGAAVKDRTCELRKMYFLPELRGLGLGQEILDRCIEGAGKAGYRRMYLETLESMSRARALYQRNGFERLPKALGCTGHHGCDSFYARAVGT